MAYDKNQHGITSRAKPASASLKEAWDNADIRNAELPEGTEYFYVPKESVFIDEDVMPRQGGVDRRLVKDYATMLDELPPIIVQKDTFRLIDGAHRLNASYEPDAQTDHVRVIERDVKAKDLAEEAYRANAHHGRPLTMAEKTDFARLLFAKYPNKPVSDIAKESGIGRALASKIRDNLADAKDRKIVVERNGQTFERQATAPREKPATAPRAPAGGVTYSPADNGATAREPAALGALRVIAEQRMSPDEWLRANPEVADVIGELISAAEDWVVGLRGAYRNASEAVGV
jgi:hypothetical protein